MPVTAVMFGVHTDVATFTFTRRISTARPSVSSGKRTELLLTKVEPIYLRAVPAMRDGPASFQACFFL